MKEQPIIFSAESVRAICENRKTQTRRVITPQPSDHYWDTLRGYRFVAHLMTTSNGLQVRFSHWVDDREDGVEWVKSPYQVGDQLWVRETWKYADWTEDGFPFIEYKDGERQLIDTIPADWSERLANAWADLSDPDNYSPRFMPRWASRITLEVTAVRVERLQDISWNDAIAEGFCVDGSDIGVLDKFRMKWDEINGKRAPWASNPWVWVDEFEVVK